jgi:RNase P subunit RPR2
MSRKQQDSMTRIASITNNHLALSCNRCGRSAQIPVTTLIAVFGSDVTIQDAARRAQCSRCHVKSQNTFRIIYVGGSGEAMLGVGT